MTALMILGEGSCTFVMIKSRKEEGHVFEVAGKGKSAFAVGP